MVSSTKPTGVCTFPLTLQLRSGYLRGTGPVSHAPGKISADSSCSMNFPPVASYSFLTAIMRLSSPSLSIDGIAQAKYSAIAVKLFLVGFPVGTLAAHSFPNPQAHGHDFFLRAQILRIEEESGIRVATHGSHAPK